MKKTETLKFFNNRSNKRKINVIILSAIILAFFVFSTAALAIKCDEADLKGKSGAYKAQCGLQNSASQGYLGAKGEIIKETKIIQDIPTTIGKVVGAGLAFIGILFFILMIYAGFTWMLARGNEQEVTKAKELIYAAVIGLIIVLAAYAITAYIGGALTS